MWSKACVLIETIPRQCFLSTTSSKMLQVGHCIIYLLMPVLQVLAECKKFVCYKLMYLACFLATLWMFHYKFQSFSKQVSYYFFKIPCHMVLTMSKLGTLLHYMKLEVLHVVKDVHAHMCMLHVCMCMCLCI